MSRVIVMVFALAVMGALAQQVPTPSGVRLDPAAKRALVERALSLRAGDTRETVIERLGKPAIDRATTMSGSRVISRSLKYYVQKSTSGGAALDEYIDVYLDKNNRVDAVYLNVELK